MRDIRVDERGTMLIITLNVIIILVALSAAFLSVAFQDTQELRSSEEKLKAFYIAEAGINACLFDLRSGGAGNLGAPNQAISLNGGSYWTTVDDTDPAHLVAQSRGNYGGLTQTIEVVLAYADPFWKGAAVGDTPGVSVTGRVVVDSYDSTSGTYDTQKINAGNGETYASDKGDVISNGDITVGATSSVFGNVESDAAKVGGLGDGDDDDDGIAGPSVIGFVDGTTKPRSDTVEFPPLAVPDTDLLPAFPMVINNGFQVLPAGEYRFTSLSVEGNSTVMIQGPTTIVADSLRLTGNTVLQVDTTGGPVYVFVKGSFEVLGSTVVKTTTGRAQDLQFYVLLDNYTGHERTTGGDPSNPINVGGNSVLNGGLYAPNSVARVSEDAELYGSVIARRVELEDQARVHFDEDMREWPGVPGRKAGAPQQGVQVDPGASPPSGDPETLSVISWRVVTSSPDA